MNATNQIMKPSRAEERRTMFLAAFLASGGSTTKCRIRNMTKSGALVECDANIPSGSTVIVNRGKLSVAGQIKWSIKNRFGMEFTEQVDIDKWLREPSFSRTAPITPINGVLSHEAPLSLTELDIVNDKIINERIAEELYYISRIVSSVSELLINDPFLKIRHATSLQQLDMGQQMLHELAQIVTLESKMSRIPQVATGPMRGRLLRAKPL